MNEETISFPVLDLGELGKAFEDAIKDDSDIDVDPAAQEVIKPDAAKVEGQEPDAEADAAADAEPKAEAEPEQADPESEAAYKARFEAEYAKRSREDIGKLRSSLDKQITNLTKAQKAKDLELEEASAYVKHLEEQLAEYDPDEVKRWQANRTRVKDQLKRDTRIQEIELENRRNFRDREFRRLYPDLDPDEPVILEAFLEGNHKLEAALIRERLLRVPIQPTQQAAAPVVAKTNDSQQVLATPKDGPERDKDGKFVSKKAEATRKREQARGHETISSNRPSSQTALPINTLAGARAAMKEGFARLGVPMQ